MRRLYVIVKAPEYWEFWDGSKFTPCLQYAMMFSTRDEADYERQTFCQSGVVAGMDTNFFII